VCDTHTLCVWGRVSVARPPPHTITLSPPLSLYLSPSPYISPALFTQTHSLSLFISLSQTHPLSLPIVLYNTLSFSRSLTTLFFSHNHTHSLTHTLSLFVWLSLALSNSFSFIRSFSLALSLSSLSSYLVNIFLFSHL